MNRDPKQRCEQCRYWDDRSEVFGTKLAIESCIRGGPESYSGVCRIRAPIKDGFPITTSTDWCAEFSDFNPRL